MSRKLFYAIEFLLLFKHARVDLENWRNELIKVVSNNSIFVYDWNFCDDILMLLTSIYQVQKVKIHSL